MLTRFGQVNLLAPSPPKNNKPASVESFPRFSGGLNGPGQDTLSIRFAGKDCEDCKVREQREIERFQTKRSRNAVLVLNKLQNTGHPTSKGGQQINWEYSMMSQLLLTPEVQNYLQAQGVDAREFALRIDGVYLGQPIRRVDEDHLKDFDNEIMTFAQHEKIETITPVTMWRWLMHGEEYSDRTKPEVISNLVRIGTKENVSQINQLLAAPKLDDASQRFDQWFLDNYKPILSADDPRIVEAENVGSALKSRVFGQEHALDVISQAIFNGITGLPNKKKPHRPMLRVLALGPTGSGKTFTPEELAEVLDRRVIFLSCNELQDKTQLGKLTGSGPGYAGQDSKNFVDEVIEANKAMMEDGEPPPVIIIDEVEKAHPEVWEILMTALDKGVIYGSDRSKVGYLSNAMVFASTNHGQGRMNELLDEGASKEEIRQTALLALDESWVDEKSNSPKRFKPEFLARFSDHLVYDHLSREDAERVLDAKLAMSFIEPFEEAHGSRLLIDDKVKSAILKEGYNPKRGVRKVEDEADKFFTPFNEERIRLIKAGILRPDVRGGVMKATQGPDDKLMLEFQPPQEAGDDKKTL